jgi:hypothetical protein
MRQLGGLNNRRTEMTQGLPSTIKVSELFQVAIVVRDLEESMNRYKSLLGIDSWNVVEVNSSIARLTYHGKPSQHSFKAAMTMLGSLMIELLQPLEKAGIYQDFLNAHGEGLHHLGHVRVDNLDDAVQALEKAGFPCIETGETLGLPGQPQHKWAYVDTTAALGYIIELSTGIDPRAAMELTAMS